MTRQPAPPRRGRAGARGESHTRRLLCAEAARIMAEEGVRDFHAAKRKAAERLRLPAPVALPSNQEVEAALQEHLRLFHGRQLGPNLARLRRLALEAMRFFERFDPRLVGPVLSGTVTAASEIQLHLSAETPEAVGFLLQEHRIPYEEHDRRVRFGGDRYATLPGYRFTADATPIEVSVFSREAAREPPLSPVDGRPMKRANAREVEALLSASADARPDPAPAGLTTTPEGSEG